ncbi:MAG: hypothetical protein HY907_00300 [Deltaproteobacteria bacterium]|nr:hypothetical protein [Deltaproteobacteria bacterium]
MPSRRAPLLLFVLALAAPSPSRAAGVALDRYRGAPIADDGLALSRPGDLGHLRWGVRLDFDYAMDPLVWEEHQGASSSEVGAIVEHQVVGRLTGALGLIDRLVLWVGLPVNLILSGNEYAGSPGPGGTSVGDLFAGLRGRIWGERDDLFAIAAQATLTVPTAELADDGQSFAGDWTIGGDVLLLLELRWRWIVVTADLGGRFRRPAELGSVEVGQEFLWGLGITVPALPGTLEAYLEAYGTTTFASFGVRELSPVELLGGVRVWAREGLSVALAAGSGLGTRGYGAPDVRGVLCFGWSAPP